MKVLFDEGKFNNRVLDEDHLGCVIVGGKWFMSVNVNPIFNGIPDPENE